MKGDMRMMYSVMLNTRVELMTLSRLALGLTSTIAVRYSAVRRQFKNISGQEEETKLLDYQTQQMKLFPIVAKVFAHSCGTVHVVAKFNQLLEGIKTSDFSLLPLLHHYSAGYKAQYTQESMDCLYIIRQSLGGAGYSAWSAIPNVIEAMSPGVTVEGDNTILLH